MIKLLNHTISLTNGRFLSLCIWLILITFCGYNTYGQDKASSNSDNSEPDTVGMQIRADVRPLVWFPALSGDIRFGGKGNTFLGADTIMGLDDNEPTFTGYLELNSNVFPQWSVLLDFVEFDTESNVIAGYDYLVYGNTITSGSTIISDFGFTDFGLDLGYQFYDNLLHDTDYFLTFSLLGGTRLIGIDNRVEAIGGGPVAVYEESSLLLEGGIKIIIGTGENRWEVPEKGNWDVSLMLRMGFGTSVDTLDTWVGATYMFMDNVGVYFGYRQIDITWKDDSSGNAYDFDGRLAGLCIGSTVKF